MANFIQRLFEKKPESPKISFGFRGEEIEYIMKKNSLCISSTFINGRRIYTDSIKYWKNGQRISTDEKANIFGQVVHFTNKKSDNPIIVINIDYDKKFWESLCEKHKNEIKSVEYDSNKQKEEFLFNSLLTTIQKGGSLVVDGIPIKTETEFIEHWKTRNPKQ
jgi:hypothetical protein